MENNNDNKFDKRGAITTTHLDLLCNPSLVGGLQKQLTSFSAVNIMLSITAFLGNFLILVALHKDSSLHLPSKLLYRCLATTDLLVGLFAQPLRAVYWMFVFNEQRGLCRYAVDAANVTGFALCGVSLLTTTAISVDRLLALLLGLRYKQIVTLKRTYIIVVTFCVVPLVPAVCIVFDNRISYLYGHIVTPSYMVISFASYTKIFCTLSHRNAQVLDHVQQQPSQTNALNMARYRKAMYGALWVQLALVICHGPFGLVEIVIAQRKTYSSNLVIIRGVAVVLVYFNSTLNPFLYCWRISEVRQAVKQTIRQALHCPSS